MTVNHDVAGSNPASGAIGVSPSGKATDSDSVMRRFESYYPCQTTCGPVSPWEAGPSRCGGDSMRARLMASDWFWTDEYLPTASSVQNKSLSGGMLTDDPVTFVRSGELQPVEGGADGIEEDDGEGLGVPDGKGGARRYVFGQRGGGEDKKRLNVGARALG